VIDAVDLDRHRLQALEAANVGAKVVARHATHAGERSEVKGLGDYVTNVDRESEAAIRAFLKDATPEVPIMAEEGGGDSSDLYWAVDPLDGTTNFMIGFPAVSVSVALIANGRPVAAAVRAPFLDLSFSAAHEQGAHEAGRRLRVSDRPAERAIVATALPFRARELMERYRPVLDEVFANTEDIRRAGSAALELAWVSAGVWDGYFELNLKVWDAAAGALLVLESGGVVTDWAGGDRYLSGDVLAGSPQTHETLLRAASGASAAGKR